MTILADHQIRKLCLFADTICDEDLYLELVKKRVDVLDLLFPTKNEHYKAIDALRKAATREATEEEVNNFVPMISPYSPHQHRVNSDGAKIISWGTSSFGYDVRLAEDKFVIFSNMSDRLVDPANANPEADTIPLEILTDDEGRKYVIMPAHSYGMGYTMEYFNIPRNINVVCVGKSTYARSAVFVNVTPIEAGFKGNVVIEIGNVSGNPVKVYLGCGIAQFQFFQGDDCDVSYEDRSGKYQGQTKLTYSRM